MQTKLNLGIEIARVVKMNILSSTWFDWVLKGSSKIFKAGS